MEGIIKSKEVAKALEKVDRKHYAPGHYYMDSPQPLGYGATISAPHMHAYALEYLEKQILKAKNILDVGSGTGYLTAAMAMLAPKDCKVYGIEHVP
jgi:protein-L-isoaspartate(D-aspartate) O-methyltransferase